MKPKRTATYEDLMKVPYTMVAEIVDGELITNPRPAAPHAYAGIAMASALFDRFSGPPGAPPAPGGWWILYEPELHLGDDVLVPDLTGWRRERMPTMGDVAAFTLAPDWVCEIISPSTARSWTSRAGGVATERYDLRSRAGHAARLIGRIARRRRRQRDANGSAKSTSPTAPRAIDPNHTRRRRVNAATAPRAIAT